MANQNIRNFSIIAHIDHGKSTLADRILEKTCAVAERDMEAQLLDSMDIQILASNIEDEYHVKLAGTDLMPMNFANVDAIRDLLQSHGVEGDI